LEDIIQRLNLEVSKQILQNFSDEVVNFKQVCPIEMLNKLKNPITLKKNILETG
jgi:hypothetical protein